MWMLLRTRRSSVFAFASISFLAGLLLGPAQCAAQDGAAAMALEGTVVDPTGARIPHAVLHLQNGRATRDANADGYGHFEINLPGGTYHVSIKSPGFKTYDTRVSLSQAGEPTHLRVVMNIAEHLEDIVVDSNGAASDSSDENKTALVFSGKDLDIFSRDDATFQKQLQALAGGGPKPPQIYVNGFSSGRIPPKSSIREIRFNKNPYSALFDSLGSQRIEILTKPGTDKLHGGLTATGNDIDFNAQNPFTPSQPPYYALTLDSNFNGPIGKKTSFYLGGTYNNQQNNAAVNAFTLDPASLLQVQLSQAVPNPITTSTYSLRLDREVTDNNTFIGSYQFNQINVTNGGVGLLVLPSEGFNSGTTTQTLQLSDSQVIGMKMLTESRFQYIRRRTQQDPVSTATSVLVEGAFNGGGSPLQQLHDNQDSYEFQEMVSRQQGSHFLRVGGRFRAYRDASLSTAFYNGQYLFSSLTAYQITQQGVSAGESDAAIRATCQASPTGPICGGASQLTFTVGQPNFSVLTMDVAAYAEDEWKVTKNFTLDLGFRFESQSGIPDHNNPAPRVGFAWAAHRGKEKTPWVTLRGGAGIFYDRFSAANLLTAVRQNGVTQKSYVVDNPTSYPQLTIPSAPPTIYTVDPHLRTEDGVYAGLSAEKTIARRAKVALIYTWVHGNHQYFSSNINAPLAGTYDPTVPGSGTRPLGGNQNIYQFGSGGTLNGQILSANWRVSLNRRVLWYGLYNHNLTRSDASSASAFISNPFRPHDDYGRVAQPTQSLTSGATIQLPFGVSSSLYFTAQGGTPFNITTGTDLNGDTQYNDRPSFATDLSRPSVVQTKFGNFDTAPIAGQRLVPINYGNSPNFVFLDLSLERDFAVGPRPASPATQPGDKPQPRPDRPYALSFSIDAQNIFNHVNPGTPVGVLGSPFFGKPISLATNLSTVSAANRLILLQLGFSF
jgi:hypothetical protein